MSKKLIVEATITKTVEEKLTVDVSGRAADDIQQYLDDAYCTMEGWELRDVGTTESEFAAEMKLVDRNYNPNPAGGASPEFESYYDDYRLKGDEHSLHLTEFEAGFLKCYVMTLKYDKYEDMPEDGWQAVTIGDDGRTFDINYGINEDGTFWATAYKTAVGDDGNLHTDGNCFQRIEGEMKDA